MPLYIKEITEFLKQLQNTQSIDDILSKVNMTQLATPRYFMHTHAWIKMCIQ